MLVVKKYCVILLFFLFVLIISLNNNSYAYVDCNNYIIEPKEVNTLNLSKYLNNIRYNELISFCSNERCYEVREGKIKDSINNFNNIYNKTLSNEEYEVIRVKGYPISRIVINNCE